MYRQRGQDWWTYTLMLLMCAWYVLARWGLFASFLFSVFNTSSLPRIFSVKKLVAFSLHYCWTFALFTLFSCNFESSWLLLVKPSFIIQIFFQPPFHFLFLLLLPFRFAMEGFSLSTSIQLHQLFEFARTFTNDKIDKYFTLKELKLRVFSLDF